MEAEAKPTPPAKNSTLKRRNGRRALLGVVGLTVAAVIVVVAIQLFGGGSHKAGAPADTTPTARVLITAHGFEPAELIVNRGTKVIWTNEDTDGHSVGANPYPSNDSLKSLVSPILSKGQEYGYTFSSTGTYYYHDGLQPKTNGTIIVR